MTPQIEQLVINPGTPGEETFKVGTKMIGSSYQYTDIQVHERGGAIHLNLFVEDSLYCSFVNVPYTVYYAGPWTKPKQSPGGGSLLAQQVAHSPMTPTPGASADISSRVKGANIGTEPISISIEPTTSGASLMEQIASTLTAKAQNRGMM